MLNRLIMLAVLASTDSQPPALPRPQRFWVVEEGQPQPVGRRKRIAEQR